ncbi:MAG: hypothetical protein ACRDJN_05710 [Chloroflexota bacterium]
MQANTGAARLASTLTGMIRRQAGALDQDWLDLATVQADGGLRLDRFPAPFPAATWYVLEQPAVTLTVAPALVGGANEHSHTITQTFAPLPLAAGDRVLVAIANDGADPVVLGRVRRTA